MFFNLKEKIKNIKTKIEIQTVDFVPLRYSFRFALGYNCLVFSYTS